jgi:hypothetical protein
MECSKRFGMLQALLAHAINRSVQWKAAVRAKM